MVRLYMAPAGSSSSGKDSGGESPAARRRGRPSKLTPEVLTGLEQMLASGCTVETAAEAHGVARGTVHAWLARGQAALSAAEERGEEEVPEGELLYAQLVIGIEESKARAKIAALGAVRAAAAKGVWQAAAWFLERTFPEEFGTVKRSGAGGRPVGATSAPDRPSTGDEPPPRVRMRRVK